MRLLIPTVIALAAWWCWTSAASAEPSTAAAPDGLGNTGPVDVEPLTQALTTTLRLLPAATHAVVGGDPIGDVLHHVAAPLPGVVEGIAEPLPAVVGDVIDPLHDVDAALRPLSPAAPAAPEPIPLAAPQAPDPTLAPTPKAPAGRPFMRTVTARRAPRSPMVVQAAGPWWHDERAWAPETAAAPPALASTPAAGNTTTVLRAAARPPAGDAEHGHHSSRRAPAPLAPAGSGSTAGPGTGDGGQRTDRGPLMSGTPGARTAFDAVSTAALVSAAVEAPEDGPASLPPTTPD